jgi:Uma2 family endonuclease
MATITRVWTSADLEDVPEDQSGKRYEIIDGELIVTPSPVPRHQLLAVRLTLRFGSFVEAHRLGQIWGDRVDIKLGEGEALVIPDLSFIRRDRLGIVGPTAIDGVPDLVLEILSPSTRHRDLGEKMALYARYGVTEYWVVDPEARSVRVLILTGDRYEALEQPAGVARSRVLPGLEVDVAALFAELA